MLSPWQTLDHGSADSGLLAKSCAVTVFVNRVSHGHTHTCRILSVVASRCSDRFEEP